MHWLGEVQGGGGPAEAGSRMPVRAGALVGEVAPFIERGLVVLALGQDSIDQFPGRVVVVVDSEVEALRAGRMGAVRLLRQPYALLWGLRLHLLCTLGGLPIAFALTGAKADERETLLDIFATEPALVTDRPPGQTLIGDKNNFGCEFESQLADLI